ncbi:hypothetical protein AWB70_04689 [Caballeronia cordobensis]|uniref:Uncharacterized protein n=1 Tax=Caballeronia cordobensis TaxID=1353886 RepID=A0A158IFH8_CABCO|nr:hypothetical protein [Caballeronia cordobensis]SAL55009.1 hypothetical protein AWB70_04689 [Caballeronia cordobensis]
MKAKIDILGDAPIRVIVDRNAVSDTVLEAGATVAFDSAREGVIELRELGDTDDGGDAEEREQP